jgi:tRNA(fMet)-specific endonuclease VapC
MRYLLDTYVISDFIKGESGTTKKLKQTLPIEITVSTIILIELRYFLDFLRLSQLFKFFQRPTIA